MCLLLHIETSSDVCSVSLSERTELLITRKSTEKNVHSSELSLYIGDLFDQSEKKISDLDAVAVSKGPGSFTGLRIGVSMAKGIAYGLEIPLISVNTLETLAIQFLNERNISWLYCPVIDAKNGEFYFSLYDHQLKLLNEIHVGKLEESFFRKISKGKNILFAGNGNIRKIEWINKLESYENQEIRKKEARWFFTDKAVFNSVFMVPLAYAGYLKKEFEDLVHFEPFYLKDFKARKGSIKIKRILGLEE